MHKPIQDTPSKVTTPEPLPLLRFIPFRKSDIIDMCLSDNILSEQQKTEFSGVAQQIEKYFQQEFWQIRESLKSAYALVDPDSDTHLLAGFSRPEEKEGLVPLLENVLQRGNYDRVSEKTLKKALKSSSLFQLRLHVDMSDFAEILLYTRGASKRQAVLREFFGLWKRKVRFTNYERVVLFIRFHDDLDSESALGVCPPGSTMLKLFRNVPEADVEMLFPNIRLGMRFMDKLMIGVPALISGTIVASTKLGATMLLLGSLLGFWLGTSTERVELDKTAVIALVAGLGALGGYVWKQISNFRNRKLKYTQALTENLYFKLLDNNAGVIFRILDDAEESEIKECLLAYYFLLITDKALTADDLDQQIENWMADKWHYRPDFDVLDALGKLAALGLANEVDSQWQLAT